MSEVLTPWWSGSLPSSAAFVLSGRATLGAIHVGMLRALGEVGLSRDLVVGTSGGSLNGAVLAEHGDPTGAAALEQVWSALRRRDVFGGGPAAQAVSVAPTGHLHPRHGLIRSVRHTL